MYLELFQEIMGFISVTGNALIDMLILVMAAKIVHSIVFSFVGKMFKIGIISGSFAGKIAYLFGWIICLIPAVGVLFVLGKLVALYTWIF